MLFLVYYSCAMPKSAVALVLSADDRERLSAWLRAPSTPQQVALRCRIALAAAQGQQDLEIAAQLKLNRHTPCAPGNGE